MGVGGQFSLGIQGHFSASCFILSILKKNKWIEIFFYHFTNLIHHFHSTTFNASFHHDAIHLIGKQRGRA